MFVTLCEVNSNGVKFFSEGSLLQKKKKKFWAQLAEANYPQKKKKRGIRKNGHWVFTFEKVNLIYDSTLSTNDLFWWLATTIKEER